MNALSRSHILILGLGESGLAMALWCARQGARVRVADSRSEPPGMAALQAAYPEIEILSARMDNALLEGIDCVAVSPGIDPRVDPVSEAYRRGLPVTGEMDLLAQALLALDALNKTKVLAITGTNGKTTTTLLCAHLLQHAGLDAVAAGNVSPSALDVLMARLDAQAPLPQCWVLELSSFQLETFERLHCDAATVLNVSDDHLDRYNNFNDYALAKTRIFAGQGLMVLNRDDQHVMSMQRLGRSMLSFGLDAPAADLDFGLRTSAGKVYLSQGADLLLPLEALPLQGLHNAANVMAALALCSSLNLPMPVLLEGLKSFRGLAHRVQPVAERVQDQVLFIDDSKGTNVGATLAALQGLGRKVVLIAGGDGKGQDFSPLAPVVMAHARAVVLIGRDARLIESALLETGVPLYFESTLEAAVCRANALAQAGEAVLLSPACASLDMFKNYAHRAEVFTTAARALPGVKPWGA